MKINLSLVIFILSVFSLLAAEEPDPTDFFEKKIHPVFVQKCYQCHSTTHHSKGGLELDSRQGWMTGGKHGQAIVPGKPNESLLIQVLDHSHDLKMPKDGVKLADFVIQDFREWITNGAIDPRKVPSDPMASADHDSWESVNVNPSDWWSFQPAYIPSVPVVDGSFSNHPIDLFIQAKLAKKELSPTIDADCWTILRRLHYVITGLPANDRQQRDFSNLWETEGIQKSVSMTVDKLLTAPQFGERWARHWMDWYRYSEGHGGQSDTTVEQAFEYRDYLIRALNKDISYKQLILEHLAGDLLKRPRLDDTGMINESRIGLGHFRFVEHGYIPVDSLDELVKFTDNQIDVVTKATLSLTVSCARCHDHKFDPISQEDYYALFGFFASSRPTTQPLVTSSIFDQHRQNLNAWRSKLKKALKTEWLQEVKTGKFSERLKALGKEEKEPFKETDLLYPWFEFDKSKDFQQQWQSLLTKITAIRTDVADHNKKITVRKWDFQNGIPDDFYIAQGEFESVPAGELGLGVDKDDEILSVLPAGVISHSATTLEEGSLASSSLTVPDGALAVRWAGAGAALARLIPNNYPIPASLLYKQFDVGIDGSSSWYSQETDYWKGENAYFQFMTRRTAPNVIWPPNKQRDEKYHLGYYPNGSWFSVSEIRFLKDERDQIQDELFSISPLITTTLMIPTDEESLLANYREALEKVLNRWQNSSFSDEEARFLTVCLQKGLLSTRLADMPSSVTDLFYPIRKIEAKFKEAALRAAPGVIDSPGRDHPLYARGNHRSPEKDVPRSFLKILGGENLPQIKGCGRLELAQQLTSDCNPLFARVIANRVWYYVFGKGLVETVDNFGTTGSQPTHPELLEHLAHFIKQKNWSLKETIRYLLTSRTFRLSSKTEPKVMLIDPSNDYLTRANVRRMDAEVIHDHLLSVSGNLDLTMYGESQAISSPPEKDKRRGLYISTKRKGQYELFEVFDVPVPSKTRGRRDVSTIPAQAVTLLNSPFIHFQAETWAEKANGSQTGLKLEAHLSDLIVQAYSRPAKTKEMQILRQYYQNNQMKGTTNPLKKVAHLIFMSKEFVYLQ